MFATWGRLVYRFRWLVLAVSAATVAVSVAAILTLSTRLATGASGNASMESWRAHELTRRELPAEGVGFTLIFTARDPTLKATDPAFTRGMNAALGSIVNDPRVANTTTSPSFISRDGRRAFVLVSMRDGLEAALKEYPALRARVVSDQFDILATGVLPLEEDFARVSEADLRRAELFALPLTLLLLTVVFGLVLWRLLRRTSLRTVMVALGLVLGSLLLALLPLLVGAFAILGGVAGIFALAHVRDMSIYALNIASMIGLGLAIDYSLFLVSRFLDELEANSVPDAIARMLATTGKAIAFSGLTVAIGVAGLVFYRDPMLKSIGLAAMLVVGTSLLYGLTFLPALLAIVGNGVAARARGRGLAVRQPGRNAGTTAGFWHALASGVMDHPWAVLLPLLVLLVAAGSPVLRLRIGLIDATALPRSTESRQGYDLLTTEFAGSETTTIEVVINVPSGQPLSAARLPALYDFSRRLAQLPGVARVDGALSLPGSDGRPLTLEQLQALYARPPDQLPDPVRAALSRSVGAHIVLLAVRTPLSADSDGARALVQQIRAERGRIKDGEVLVGGQTASILDQLAQLKQDTAPAVIFIVAATYAVLFLLLGSVLLPLKAVVMNLLSISASYGALVWIFQEGHLSRQLGFTPSAIEPSVPVLMFCLLFGLSMDYEVLLLSRMKEEYARSGDNRHAVAEGLEQTGRLITGAAAIMVTVFAAFALADLVVIKSIGFGMALAVAIDALVVRTLIVPATMRLLGNRNWWAPAPLARLHQRLGLAEESVGSRAGDGATVSRPSGPLGTPTPGSTTLPAANE